VGFHSEFFAALMLIFLGKVTKLKPYPVEAVVEKQIQGATAY